MAPEASGEQRAPAAQHHGYVDPAANRDIADARTGRCDRPGLAGAQPPARVTVGRDEHRLGGRQSDRAEDLEAGVSRVVLRRRVREREELGDERASRRNALVHPPRATGVLHRREARDKGDPDHRDYTNVTRSPSASVAPERASNIETPTAAPMRCHPPGDASG